jgi:acetyl-CoA C-acetyltransferase
MGSVWIAGSYQSDFARNFAREGLEISDMVAEAVNGTLTSAGLEPEDVESIHVGNAFGQLFTGQGQLGAMPATVEPRLWGKPAARHEAACASGSVAVLAATAEIEAGRYRRAEAPGRGRLDRARGPGRHVHVAVHVQPAGRRV